jgi:hypothetical protein
LIPNLPLVHGPNSIIPNELFNQKSHQKLTTQNNYKSGKTIKTGNIWSNSVHGGIAKNHQQT